MKNIVLIGFMGSGKTTIAQELSLMLNLAWIDSDSYIANQTNSTIKDIFTQKGEAYFRTLEYEFIESFSNKENHIIATGGGMPIFNNVKKLGTCFYLQSDFEVILKRLQQHEKDSRPLFQDLTQAQELYKKRQEIYNTVSDYCINANNSKEDIINQIKNILKK